jgi:nitrogen regulatory protein PII
MRTHTRKKVELIVERQLLDAILAVLEELAAPGYTVVPTVAGDGHAGRWHQGAPSQPLQMVQVICITAAERVDPLLERVMPLLDRYAGIVYLSDVEVVRGEHF